MPYDIKTPFGVIPGQVSPAEMLAAETAARHRSVAGAQQEVLRNALPQEDTFFSEGGPFGTKPKETGAIDLASRNAAVENRQQATAGMRDQLDLLKPRDYMTATDRGDMARGKFQLDKGEMDIRNSAQGALRDELQGFLKPGGAMRAGPGMNPNAQAGGPDVNALVGGARSGNAGEGGGFGDDQIMRLALLGQLAGRGGGMDIGSVLKGRGDNALKGREFDMKKSEHDLQLQVLRQQMEDGARQRSIAEAERKRAAGSPVEPGLLPLRKPGEVAADSLAITGALDDLIKRGKGDEAMANPEAVAAEMQTAITDEVKRLVTGGASEDEARAFVKQKLDKELPTEMGTLGQILLESLPFGFLATQNESAQGKVRKGLGLGPGL